MHFWVNTSIWSGYTEFILLAEIHAIHDVQQNAVLCWKHKKQKSNGVITDAYGSLHQGLN